MRTYAYLITNMLILAMILSAEAADVQSERERTYQLDVSVQIATSSLTGTVIAPVNATETVRFHVGDLRVLGATVNGRAVEGAVTDGDLSVTAPEAGTLAVIYEGRFEGGEAVGERNFGVVTSTIDRRGVSLTGLWHPRPEGLTIWKLSATLPAGYEALSEAEAVRSERTENGIRFLFDFPHPVDGLTLVATDRYEVTTERHGNVEVAAYFFKEDRELARTYLRSVKGYLELYEKLLTPYPYKRFAVVENFLPTGYSMPTFTLLGQDVVRLPFITETSLGHEVLHQWFGNSVYVDYEQGNWVEGLTTYLADHWFEEQKGKGWEYRKHLLVNFAAYVREKDELSLRAFQSRLDLSSRAVGYGKAAMVFHMLRTKLGDEKFFGALQDVVRTNQFQAVSWAGITAAFEKRAEADLMPFFTAWIDGKGLPEVTVDAASARRKGSGFEITIELSRKGLAVPIDLPVIISFLNGGTRKETVTLEGEKKSVTFSVDEEPSVVVLDPEYDVARRPTADEMPAVIARLLGDEELRIVPGPSPEAYPPVIDEFRKGGGATENKPSDALSTEVKDAEIRTSSLVLLGADNPVVARLFGALEAPDAGFSITVRKNPWNAEKVVAIVHARSAEESAAAARKLGHYGKYSFLAFDGGRNKDKRIEPGERGLIILLREEPVVLDLALLRTLSDVIGAASDKRIVYVGEHHDQFSHHNIQVQVIRALLRKDRKIAVGMEMFQRPFQKALDEYIAGTISEREFLERTEYFKRWVFDYNLYKPILDLCRAEKIPVVALNLRREITEKVAKEGMDALTEEERKELPTQMDMADDEYRARLRQVFNQHRGSEGRNFDDFLQAQVIWDETMAESIDRYLKDNPDRCLVVVAGGGHLVYGAGIPKRAFRRNGLPYTIILNDNNADPSIADFIVLPQPLDGMTAPKLMATFMEKEKRLVFQDFVQDSPAKKAGIKADDALLALDGVPAGTIEDVKLALYLKSKGDSILVTVARKRFLFGEKVMTVEVKL